jgi:hypothetical protein
MFTSSSHESSTGPIGTKTWQSEALFVFLKLTLIALGGPIAVSKQLGHDACIVFALPNHNLDASMLPPDMRPSATNSHNRAHSALLEVKPIYFGNASDIEKLWLDSCKTLADLANSQDQVLFKKALLCLKVRL